MTASGPWARSRIRNPEREAAKLKTRFAAVSRRSFRRQPPRFLRAIDWPLALLLAGIAAVAALTLYRWTWNSNMWPAQQAILMTAMIRTCEDARSVGVAPLFSGYPGYQERLDRDGDGVACEPFPF